MGEVDYSHGTWTIHVPYLAILVSAILVLSCGQTDRQNHRQTEAYCRVTDADNCYTDVTIIGVSNDDNDNNK